MPLLHTERELRLWEYTVSLRQLLLRSPKGESGERTNLDVIFVGVRFLNIPVEFRGLTVSNGTPEHAALLERITGRTVSPERVFLLQTQGHEYTVVAAGVRTDENDLDLFESSLEFSRNEAPHLKTGA